MTYGKNIVQIYVVHTTHDKWTNHTPTYAVQSMSHGTREKVPEGAPSLTKLKVYPPSLTEVMHRLCSVIIENQQHFTDWEHLLFCPLKMGFHHLNPEEPISTKLIHTEHHQKLIDIVFKSGEMEPIADLLQAWALKEDPQNRPDTPLSTLVGPLVSLNCHIRRDGNLLFHT